MNECISPMQLEAYRDGELSAVDTSAVADHVRGCDVCAKELKEMGELSAVLCGHAIELGVSDITSDELARLHARVETSLIRADRQSNPFPAVKALMALAASVLIIAAAWLSEMPRPTVTTPSPTVIIAGAPRWERVAVTLQVDPPVPGTGMSGLADEEMANWMLQNLQPVPAADPTEQRPS
ncbi:MAG TPA: hypothetical protein VFW23_08520 [Tepidisphaeraceae bacterium]|nr:hypothetical protein [Tepidisphaeraceae bacterium]